LQQKNKNPYKGSLKMKFSLIQNDKSPNEIKIILTYDVTQDRPVSISIMHDLLNSVGDYLTSTNASNNKRTNENVRNFYDKATHHFYSELIVSKSNFFDAFKKLIKKLYNNDTFIAGSKLVVNLLTISIDANMFDKEKRLELFNLTNAHYPKLNQAFNLKILLNKTERSLLVFGFFRQEEPIDTSEMSFYMPTDIQTLTANKFIC